MKKTIFISICLCLPPIAAIAQTGGIYELKQTVTANGGGTSAGGTFSVEGTAGQTVTDRSAQAVFNLESGFWQSSFTPTAAGVSVSGRVRTAGGRGVVNAIVTVALTDGTVRSVRTGSFGYYRFDQLEAGSTVAMNVSSKRFRFQPIVLTLSESVNEIDFTATGN